MATTRNPLRFMTAEGPRYEILEDHVAPFQRLATEVPDTDAFDIASTRDESWMVYMDIGAEGDLQSEVPNIVLHNHIPGEHDTVMSFTWDEARAVALALLDVTTVADRG